MAGSVAVLLRCHEIGCAVVATSVGAGGRNRFVFVAEPFVIRRTLGLAFLGVKAITRAGHRSPSLLRSIRRFGSLVSFLRREEEPLLRPLLPHPIRPQLSWTQRRLLRVLRSLGLSEDLSAVVRAAFPSVPAQTQKKEQRLLQLRGLIDSAKSHADRLERSLTHHRSQLDTCVANPDKKVSEVKKLEDDCWLLTDGKLSPNASPMVSAHVSPVHSDCESEGENAMEMEEAPLRVFFSAIPVWRDRILFCVS